MTITLSSTKYEFMTANNLGNMLLFVCALFGILAYHNILPPLYMRKMMPALLWWMHKSQPLLNSIWASNTLSFVNGFNGIYSHLNEWKLWSTWLTILPSHYPMPCSTDISTSFSAMYHHCMLQLTNSLWVTFPLLLQNPPPLENYPRSCCHHCH